SLRAELSCNQQYCRVQQFQECRLFDHECGREHHNLEACLLKQSAQKVRSRPPRRLRQSRATCVSPRTTSVGHNRGKKDFPSAPLGLTDYAPESGVEPVLSWSCILPGIVTSRCGDKLS